MAMDIHQSKTQTPWPQWPFICTSTHSAPLLMTMMGRLCSYTQWDAGLFWWTYSKSSVYDLLSVTLLQQRALDF